MTLSMMLAFIACVAGGVTVVPVVAALSGMSTLSTLVLGITFVLLVVLALVGTPIERAAVIVAALLYWGVRLGVDRWLA